MNTLAILRMRQDPTRMIEDSGQSEGDFDSGVNCLHGSR